MPFYTDLYIQQKRRVTMVNIIKFLDDPEWPIWKDVIMFGILKEKKELLDSMTRRDGVRLNMWSRDYRWGIICREVSEEVQKQEPGSLTNPLTDSDVKTKARQYRNLYRKTVRNNVRSLLLFSS